MKRIFSIRPLARPARTGSAGLHVLSMIGAAAIVALTAFFTSAQAQYLVGYGGYRGYYGGYGYGPRYYGGHGYPRSYAGYFAPGQLGPEFGPGYYEVTVFPTTYYDLPPYEEPGYYYYGYRGW